jgi:hypothetical protein
MSIILSRRGLVAGLISLVATPAIVRATSLMPVTPMKVFNPHARFFAGLRDGWGQYDPYDLLDVDPIDYVELLQQATYLKHHVAPVERNRHCR